MLPNAEGLDTALRILSSYVNKMRYTYNIFILIFFDKALIIAGFLIKNEDKKLILIHGYMQVQHHFLAIQH